MSHSWEPTIEVLSIGRTGVGTDGMGEYWAFIGRKGAIEFDENKRSM